MNYSISKSPQNTIVDKSKQDNFLNVSPVGRHRDWHLVFILSSLSFLTSMFLSSWLSLSWVQAGWFLLLAAILGSVFAFYFKVSWSVVYFFIIIFVGSAGGILRPLLEQDYSHELDNYLAHKVLISAEVVYSPDERETLTKLVVHPLNYQAKILLTTERYPQYSLGDVIALSGKISRPKNTFSTNGTFFDYQSYLAKDGIYYEMYKPNVSLISRPTTGVFVFLSNLKSWLIKKINDILPEPESSLLAGILLGAKKGLGTEVTNNFKLAGVSHILVLSGYNITFVALILLRLFSLLPRLFGGILGFASIIIFGLLAGGGSVVWRAVLMSLIALYAKLTGRIFDVTAAIIFSAVALVAYNPKTLTSDLGFQLSVLAMLGLVYLSPVLKDKIFYWLPTRFGLQELICSTFGAQLAVIPLLWQTVGQVSLWGFVSNLVVLPFVPYSMMIGALAVLLSQLSFVVAQPISFLAYLLLKIILSLVEFFAQLSLVASIGGEGFSFLIWLIYLPLCYLTGRYWYKIYKKITV